MLNTRMILVIVSVLGVCRFGMAAEIPKIVITKDGQTIGVPPDMRGAKTVAIEIVGGDRGAEYELAYEGTDAIRTPVDLTDVHPTIRPVRTGDSYRFELTLPDGKEFAIYEVRLTVSQPGDAAAVERATRRREEAQSEIDRLKRARDNTPAARALKTLDEKMAAAEERKAKLDDEIPAIERRIAAVDEEITLIKAVESHRTIGELRRLLDEKRRIATEKEKVIAAQKVIDREIEAIQKLKTPEQDTLNQAPESAQIERLTNEVSDLTDVIDTNASRTKTVKRIKQGLIVTGENEQVAYYGVSLVSRDEAVTMVPKVRIERVGRFPDLQPEDHLTVVILNDKDEKGYPSGYLVALAVTAGVPRNIEAIRPVFDAPESAPLERLRIKFTADKPFRDVPFVIEKRFAGHEKLELTISGLVRVVTKDETETDKDGSETTRKEETKFVTFVDKAELPPVAKLYRYNLNSGIVFSGLEDREFTKVRTIADDTATPDVNESRYRINEDRTARKAIPMASFTLYWKPIDIEKPPTAAERWTPQPTIGFGATQPLKNVLVGFTNSLTRNVQLAWGVHRGMVKELVVRDDVTEDRDATAPTTREKVDHSFFVGLSFNLNILTKLLPATQ